KLKIATAVLLVGVLAGGVAMLALPPLATGQTDARKAGKPEPAPKEPELAAKKADKAQVPNGWKERLAIKAPEKSQAFALAVSPDGKAIAVCYGTKTRVLDATTGKELLTLSGTEKSFPRSGLAFSPDGKLIAQSGDDADVLLCSADSGEVKAKLEYPKGVASIAFSPDGKVLATSVSHEYGDEVRLWDLATNKVLHELKSRARSLAFSADGKKLAIAECSDSTAKVWDVETGKELATFGKSPDQVLAVAFSPDGKTLAAANASEDPNVKLWDVATGKERFTLKGPTC